MNTLLLAGSYVATLLVALLCLRNRPFKLLDPGWAFLGGYFINYCVRPTLFLIDPELGSAYSGMYDDAIIRRGFAGAMVFAVVGLAGFAIGNLSFSGASKKRAHPLPPSNADDISFGSLFSWISFSFLLAGCAGLYGFISQVGWVGTVIELLQGGQRNAFMLVIFGHGQYMFAMQLSLLGWAMICTRWFSTPLPIGVSSRAVRRIVQIGWFLVTLGIWIAFGERSSILAVLFIPLALGQTMHQHSRLTKQEAPGKKRSRLVAFVLAGVFFAVAGPIGLLMKNIEVSPAAAVSMSISAWDSFEFTVIAHNQVRARDLLWGKTYWQDLVYTWFPRSLFPWKPDRYGSVLVQDLVAPELMDHEGATFPPGILVEAFCNFGYLGLFLMPFLIGILCRAIYNFLQQSNWLWLVLMAISFCNLASFRGFGGFVAILAANGAVLCVVLAVRGGLESVRLSLGRLQPQSIS